MPRPPPTPRRAHSRSRAVDTVAHARLVDGQRHQQSQQMPAAARPHSRLQVRRRAGGIWHAQTPVSQHYMLATAGMHALVRPRLVSTKHALDPAADQPPTTIAEKLIPGKTPCELRQSHRVTPRNVPPRQYESIARGALSPRSQHLARFRGNATAQKIRCLRYQIRAEWRRVWH